MLTDTVPAPSTESVAELVDLDRALSLFTDLRPRLLAVAQRILGNRVEAEDTVQDAWLRWQLCDRTVVVNPTAFLVTMVTRLALNTTDSARVRHGSRGERWLPEQADPAADPTSGAERDETLGEAIQLLSERLAPVERAAYVLRHAFDYPYDRIAELLDLSEQNTRQVVSRAGKHLASGRRRPVSRIEQRRLVRAFAGAARGGDMARLEQHFAAQLRIAGRNPVATSHRLAA